MRAATWQRTLGLACCGVLMLAAPPAAQGYDSRCATASGGECEDGVGTARNRWVTPHSEHRELYALTLAYAGVPASAREEKTRLAFVGSATVELDGEEVPSLEPVVLDDVRATVSRTLAPDELAQLPDFGYALWDWARGHETCPPDPSVGAEVCHRFKGHMGALNSNHFMPQARGFYAHYHALALQRADECAQMQELLGAQAPRFVEYLQECEIEALMIEAVGQHFLQDAWSSGHMWERWGSADLADMPSVGASLAIGAASGILHGARAVVEDYGIGGGPLIAEVNDKLCAPHSDVRWVDSDGEPQVGLGDMYLSDLHSNEDYGVQRAHLFSCATAGVRQVYERAGAQHGPLDPQVFAGAFSVDPLAHECFDQRVTNEALYAAMGLDVTTTLGTSLFIPFDNALLSRVLFYYTSWSGDGVSGAAQALSESEGARFAYDLMRVRDALWAQSQSSPNTTGAARGHLPSVLSVRPNSFYADALPSYVDSALPWRVVGSGTTERTRALAASFHRAHAREWCDAVGESGYQIESLRDRLRVLDEAAQSTGLSPAHQQVRGATFLACVEYAQRHVRIGEPADYTVDAAREPLCHFLAPGAAHYVYLTVEQAGLADLPRDLAVAWCSLPAEDEEEPPLSDCGEPIVTPGERDGDVEVDAEFWVGQGSIAYDPQTRLIDSANGYSGSLSASVDDEYYSMTHDSTATAEASASLSYSDTYALSPGSIMLGFSAQLSASVSYSELDADIRQGSYGQGSVSYSARANIEGGRGYSVQASYSIVGNGYVTVSCGGVSFQVSSGSGTQSGTVVTCEDDEFGPRARRVDCEIDADLSDGAYYYNVAPDDPDDDWQRDTSASALVSVAVTLTPL